MAEPRRTGTSWLYLQADLDRLDRVGRLIARVVQPWAGHHPAVRRWFHLQYADATGLTLRLRLEVPSSRRREVGRELGARLAAESGVLAVRERMFAPEHAKFGHGAELETALDAFCRGTGVAVRIADAPAIPVPVLTAAAQLALTAHLAPARRQGFLYHYAWYWAGRGSRGPLWRSPAAAPGTAALLQDAERWLGEEVEGRALAAYGTWLATAVAASVRAPRSTAMALHLHLHLLANRLGVVPAQEAAVARRLALHWLTEAA